MKTHGRDRQKGLVPYTVNILEAEMMTWVEKSTNALLEDRGAQTGTTRTNDGNLNVSGEREKGQTLKRENVHWSDCIGVDN